MSGQIAKGNEIESTTCDSTKSDPIARSPMDKMQTSAGAMASRRVISRRCQSES
jgi:hypothetical protein